MKPFCKHLNAREITFEYANDTKMNANMKIGTFLIEFFRRIVIFTSILLFVSQSDNLQVVHAKERLNMDEFGTDLEPHPDINLEHYPGMIYVGRMHHDSESRIGFEEDNGEFH